jgi:hypothetical protein
MEIDFSAVKFHKNIPLLITLAAMALLILGGVGWFVLPDGKVLTWSEWQVFQQHQQYIREVGLLTRNADALVGLTQGPPDPVRAQLLSEKVSRDLDDVTLAALAGPKAELLAAVDIAVQWSLGGSELQPVLDRIAVTNQVIAKALELVARPTPTTPAPTDG